MTSNFMFYDCALQGVNITFATGTYTGDTTKDGNVVITIKKVVKGMLEDSESLELVDVPSEYASEFIWKATISGNTMTTADGDGELSAWLKK